MKREVIKYGLKLKKTNELLKYFIDANYDGNDLCVDESYALTTHGDHDWLVDSMDKALYVMYNSTEYYNAEYETPTHYYNPEDLEVVKVKQIIEEETVPVKIVKVKLTEEAEEMDLIPNYTGSIQKDNFYMIGETGIAIDKGDYYQIIKMEGVNSLSKDESIYDKKYFQEVE